MESEMELEQDYERHEKAVVEICEPENIVAEDVEFETSIDSIDYTLFNLDISVAVVDTESEEVDAEFLEAISEIEGKKSFPCPKCTKICKSKGGLTKHTNSKHRDAVD
jgi:hypothetical protein